MRLKTKNSAKLEQVISEFRTTKFPKQRGNHSLITAQRTCTIEIFVCWNTFARKIVSISGELRSWRLRLIKVKALFGTIEFSVLSYEDRQTRLFNTTLSCKSEDFAWDLVGRNRSVVTEKPIFQNRDKSVIHSFMAILVFLYSSSGMDMILLKLKTSQRL